MRKTLLTMLFGLMASVISFSAMAEDKGTPEQAKAMVEKAIAHMKENGSQATIDEVNDTTSTMFKDRDLYVFIITRDDKGTFVGHGAKPVLIGKNLIGLKDVKGSPLVKNFIEMVDENGEGWVDYYWPHPLTKKTAAKSSFVKAFDDKLLVGVGVYK